MKIDSVKVREGTIAWINTNKNPQKYNNEVVGQIEKVLSADTFRSEAYGTDTCLKVSFKRIEKGEKYGRRMTGYVEELIQY